MLVVNTQLRVHPLASESIQNTNNLLVSDPVVSIIAFQGGVISRSGPLARELLSGVSLPSQYR